MVVCVLVFSFPKESKGQIDFGVEAMPDSSFFPKGIALDELDNLYISDQGTHKILKLSTNGTRTVFAGVGKGFKDGIKEEAKFNKPAGLAFDRNRTLYIADSENNRIRAIKQSGEVITICGNTSGFQDGLGNQAMLSFPFAIAIDANGNVFITDLVKYDARIRKLNPLGELVTLNKQSKGYLDGQLENANFGDLWGIAVDAKGALLIADGSNNCIRKVENGIVTTIAGSEIGYLDGKGTTPRFNEPYGIACDSKGIIYISDKYNHVIRRINKDGEVKLFAGSVKGYQDGNSLNSKFYSPKGLAFNKKGDLLVVDSENKKIRSISKDGIVSTISLSSKDANNSNDRLLNSPSGITLDSTGNIYVSDERNSRVYKISTNGEISSFLNGPFSPTNININKTGDLFLIDNYSSRIFKNSNVFVGSERGFKDSIGTYALFCSPSGMAIDKDNNLIVADKHNQRIRKVKPNGVTETIAGSGSCMNNNSKNESSIISPAALTLDPNGNIFVIDEGDGTIKKINQNNLVTILCTYKRGNSDGTANPAKFCIPHGICPDKKGNIYVADSYNHCIRKIDPEGNVTKVAGSKEGNVDGLSNECKFFRPTDVKLDSKGNLIVLDEGNKSIRKITPNGIVTTIKVF